MIDRMRFITENGAAVGPIGQGTWTLGENPASHARERKALQAGIEAGMTLLDTAEMYGEGRTEELLGEAICGYDRERLYLVSKVYPHNAGRKDIFQACENSLSRIGTEYLDLYLLHWKGEVPFSETVECMEELKTRNLIRHWGVSNLDVDDLTALYQLPGGENCATDQVLYHLGSRGIEYDLLPWLQEREIPVMAYCPLAQAGALRRGLLESPAVLEVANAHSATPSQILLAFLLSRPGVIPIPRAGCAEHTLENAGASKITLASDELALLDRAFPAPRQKAVLDTQ